LIASVREEEEAEDESIELNPQALSSLADFMSRFEFRRPPQIGVAGNGSFTAQWRTDGGACVALNSLPTGSINWSMHMDGSLAATFGVETSQSLADRLAQIGVRD
jgi:hypothetical protein